MKENQSAKTLGRSYAFKFLYGLMLPKFKETKETLMRSSQIDLELEKQIQTFDVSYFEPDAEHTSNESMPPSVRKLAFDLIKGVLTHEEKLRTEISSVLQKWKIDQLDKVDLTVLLLGAYELHFMKDTPAKVVINEAVNMSKQYGSNDSGSFINGIMDSLAKKNG